MPLLQVPDFFIDLVGETGVEPAASWSRIRPASLKKVHKPIDNKTEFKFQVENCFRGEV